MPVSSFSKIREMIRGEIRDGHGLLWDDAALDDIINEAQKEYALAAGSLTGSVTITAAGDVFSAPEDYFEPVKFIGSDQREKPFFSWKYLHARYPDFRKVSGTEPCGLITDFDGFGKFRIFPRLPEGTPAGTLFYRRLPRRDRIETSNVEAVKAHCLFQVFLLSDDGAASVYLDRFNAAVNAESHQTRGLAARSPIRHGRFF